MSGKDSPQSVIDAHRRRQQMTPFLIWGLVVVLVAVGVIILLVWFSGTNKPSIAFLTSPTPTSTNTVTATPVTPTVTSTVTSSPTVTASVTPTNTPSGPVEYTVKEGDNCYLIAGTFKVDFDVLLALNGFGTACPIKPGQKILIPLPDAKLPTETALPEDFPAGTKIIYTVKSGDLLSAIAARYFSTEAAIIAIPENNLKTAADLKAGQKLTIPAKIITVTPTKAPSATKAATTTSTPGGPTTTHTAVPATPSVTPTKKP